MPSVDKQIEAGRANNKAVLKKTALGLVGVIALGALGAVSYQYMPDRSASQQSAEQTAERSPTSVSIGSQDRARLQQALNAAKQALDDALNEHVVAWAPRRVEALSQRLDDAYHDYGMAAYASVDVSLHHVQDALSQLLKDYRDAYETPYEQARLAFGNDAMPSAAQLNRQALTVNPDFEPAMALQQRIAVIEDVVAMYEQARIGNIENNLKKQQQAYARIVELDPTREGAVAELARINAILREQSFNQTLQRAVAAVDAGRFEEGQAYLDEAKSMRQSSPAVAALQARIQKAVKQHGVEAAGQKITMFSRLQEWSTVKMLAEEALAKYPHNPEIKAQLDTANTVLAAEARLTPYLEAPARLADNNIRERAQSAIAEVRGLRQLSASLGEKVDQLARLIEQENTPLDVTVTSDGQSRLTVLGIGHIGTVERKTIQLKPGKYKLQASRQGYRTKVQEIVVQKSALPIVVHLACTDAV